MSTRIAGEIKEFTLSAGGLNGGFIVKEANYSKKKKAIILVIT